MNQVSRSSLTPVIWEHNLDVVDQIVQYIEEGVYCALLGPHSYGKTAILRKVQQVLQDETLLCVYINLFEIQAPTQVRFFAGLQKTIANDVSKYVKAPLPVDTEVLSSADFRGFLSECVDHLTSNLVVIFDHLEDLPTDLIRALLTSLRALHMEQQEKELRFIAIVSGALSLAALTVSEASPFYGIAERLILGDLNEEQSKTLVTTHTTSADVQFSLAALSLLLKATRGNPHLIKYICKHSLVFGTENKSKQVSAKTVNRVIREFLLQEASGYGPLQDATRLIEDDPDLLQSILSLLKNEAVPLRELPLPLLPDLDPLYLTGMVERVEPNSYRIRNEIYRRYLSEHFDAARAGHLLAVSGRWDAAIDHLEASIISGNEDSRSDLLTATISSIYGSETEEQAAYYLVRGLSAAFQVEQISVWLLARDGKSLELVEQRVKTVEDGLHTDVQKIPIDADKIEARSINQACVLRESRDDTCIKYVIPLMASIQAPVGVVTLCESVEEKTTTNQRKREFQLQSFLNQAARALYEVEYRVQQYSREKQRLQFEETLRDISLIIGGSLERKEVLHRILEEMRKVLPFDTASIQLADGETQSLKIIANTGFDSPEIVKNLSFPIKDDYPNVIVYKNKESLHFDDVQEQFPHFGDPHYQATHVRGWLGAPLIIDDEAIGVITLDSKNPGIYTTEHDRMAVLFAGQASVAIKNADLFEAEKGIKEYLDLLVGSSQDGIIAVDNQGWVIRYSEGAQKILGYVPDEVLNRQKRVDELYGSLDVARDINTLLLDSDKVRDYETTVLDKDSKPIPIVLSASLLRDKNGKPFGSVGFFKDLRPLRKVEKNLRMILDTVNIMSRVDHSEAGLSALAERIVTAQPVTFCCILLLDESKQNLVVKVAYPNPRLLNTDGKWEPTLGKSIPLTQAGMMVQMLSLPTSQVYKQGQEIKGTNVIEYIQQLVLLDEDIHSVLVIPLKAGSEGFGVCILGEARSWDRSPFDQEKIEIVSSMITQGTVFVDRLWAHEATKNKLIMVERLRSIGEELATASPGTSKGILDKVVQAACEVIGANSAVIYPWNEELRTYDTQKIVHFGLSKKKSFSDKVRDEEGSMTGIVVKKGMVIADDIQDGYDRSGKTKIWVREGGFLAAEGVQAFVGVSLRMGADALGVLFVNFLEPHYFSDSELETVSIFANQAAIAIENARLYDNLTLRLEESLTLQKVGSSLTETRDLNQVLDRVLQAAFELIHADEANIIFYDESEDTFRVDALMSKGIGQPLLPYKTRTRQRDGYTYEIIKRKKHVSISDTTLDPKINPVTLQKGRRAAFGVPLIGRESPVGVLWMHWKTPHQISGREERLLTAIAGQAAVSIENANLFDQLQTENIRRNEESRALQEVGISLTETIEETGVLDRVFQAALSLVDAEEGSILFYDESQDKFKAEALMCKGIGQPLETYPTRVRQHAGLAYEIVKGRKPIIISDTRQDSRISKVAIEKGRRATVGVPLLDYEGPVGVLWVNWKTPRQISSNEASLLTALASQATVAIKGAKRYDEIRRRSTHLQAVHKAGKVISEASIGLDRQQVLDRILEQAIDCATGVSECKAALGTIHLLNDETNELIIRSVFPRDYPQDLIAKFDHISLDPNRPEASRIGVIGRAAMTKQAQLVPDVNEDRDYIAHNAETKSELAIPMLDNGRLIGVMDVESNEPSAFDELDKDSLSHLVDLAVVALRNAQQAEQLTRSNVVALMGAWGAEMVHVVNREVGHIRREVFLLQKQPDFSEKTRERLNFIDAAAARLALPKIPEYLPGSASFTASDSSFLDSAIHEVVKTYRLGHPAISFLFEPGCPDIQVAMHEKFILAIFQNLLRNAIHALSKDEVVEKNIQIRSHIDGDMAVIEVENSGPPLRSEIIPYLFKRLISHDDGRKGRGLLLVGFIVERHGGRIEPVQTKNGQGVMFRFWLPIFNSQ